MPSWDTILTFCVGFLVGAFTGAAGTYLADRFTDQRRNREARRTAARRLSEVQALMPELLAAIRANVIGDPTVRLCVLLSSPRVTYNSSEAFFAYDEMTHENLRGKFDILKNHRYVNEDFGSNVPQFRLTEEFVAALRAMPAVS